MPSESDHGRRNAFTADFLERLDEIGEPDGAHEADVAGPWVVRRVPYQGGTGFALLREWESPEAGDVPYAVFARRDVALLAAAVLPATGRELIFRLETEPDVEGFAVLAGSARAAVRRKGPTVAPSAGTAAVSPTPPMLPIPPAAAAAATAAAPAAPTAQAAQAASAAQAAQEAQAPAAPAAPAAPTAQAAQAAMAAQVAPAVPTAQAAQAAMAAQVAPAVPATPATPVTPVTPVIGYLRDFDEGLAGALHVAAALVRSPAALASLLEAAGHVALEQAGRILGQRIP